MPLRRIPTRQQTLSSCSSTLEHDSHAVIARVTSSDNKHVLAARIDVPPVLEVRVEQAARVLREELHRKVDAVEVAVLRASGRALAGAWKRWSGEKERTFILRSRGQVAPVAMINASLSARMSLMSCVTPTAG